MDGTRPRPTERVVVGGWDEEIDVEIAPLIRSLWEAGIETVMSCQDTGNGWVWIEFADLEGLEEFVTIVVQMVSESSSLAKNITWRAITMIPGGCTSFFRIRIVRTTTSNVTHARGRWTGFF